MTKKILTKSELAPVSYKDLEALFETDPGQVQTFVDVLVDKIGGDYTDHPHDGEFVRKLVSGQPDEVKAPKLLTEQISGFVRIFHGWHDEDYVWHIEHASIRRPWKVSIDVIVYLIAKTMQDLLPDIEASIWLPQLDWELKSVTFKALGVRGEWSFNEEDVTKINAKLFEILQPLIR